MYKIIAAGIICLLPAISMAENLDSLNNESLKASNNNNELFYRELSTANRFVTKRKHRRLSEQRKRNYESDPLKAAEHLILGD